MARVVIVIEGGLVQEVLSDQPVDYAVVDYDTEGADEDEITSMPQGGGEFADCVGGLSTANVLPVRVLEMFVAFDSETTGDYADWKYAVDNEDTVLGFEDWLKHKQADSVPAAFPEGNDNPCATGAYATDYELGN